MSKSFRVDLSPLAAVAGHYWTLSGFLGRAWTEPALPPPLRVTVEVPSDLGPTVRLTAALHDVSAVGKRVDAGRPRRPLVVLVHGLGGNAESGYVKHVASVATGLGVSTLRVNLRGADPAGWDFYHAGLTEDLRAVLQHPAVSDYDSLLVFGFSLGGHVTLKLAAESRLPPRVKSVAALCPPLDLAASSAAFDAANLWLYRAHVLRGLKQMYSRFLSHVHTANDAALVLRLAELKLPSEKAALRIRLIREWDERVVAPRHGYSSAQEYYRAQRVSTRLEALEVPSLVVTTRWDPMVPHSTTRSFLGEPSIEKPGHPWATCIVSPKLSHWQLPSGGHVAWPSSAAPATTVIHHILQWLLAPHGD